MKKIVLHLFLIPVILFSFIFIFSSCDEDTTSPEEIVPITDDLFPMIVGRQITYNGFLRNATTDSNITSFPQYIAKWTVVSNDTLTPVGGTSNLVWDSTLVPTGISNPPVIWVETPFFIRRDPPTGTANFSFLQNIAPFYRRFNIQLSDTLRWIHLAQLDKGVNNEFTAFDSTWAASSGNVRLLIVGKFEGNVSLTVNGQSFTTYLLTTRRRIYVDGQLLTEAATASIWLAKDIGPVKMIINADGENPGHYREMLSKNF